MVWANGMALEAKWNQEKLLLTLQREVRNEESAYDAELLEESSLKALELDHCGILEFEFFQSDGPLGASWCDVHVFKCTSYTGVAQESEEMSPRWFDFLDIPYSQMWKDDKCKYPTSTSNGTSLASSLIRKHEFQGIFSV